MLPRNENRNEGTFAKTTLLETALLSPKTLFGVDKRVVSKRVVSADVPPERKPERGYVHEDGNGEKLTVKKWWLFGCRFFHGLVPIFHGLRRFFTGYKGRKR